VRDFSDLLNGDHGKSQTEVVTQSEESTRRAEPIDHGSIERAEIGDTISITVTFDLTVNPRHFLVMKMESTVGRSTHKHLSAQRKNELFADVPRISIDHDQSHTRRCFSFLWLAASRMITI